MATAPLRRRSGRVEIQNREQKIRDEIKARLENKTEQKISEEEHLSRLNKLKGMGLIK